MHRPIWELLIDGSDTPVALITHRPNVRFATYNPGGTPNPVDDLVWDKETGLIWPRNANLMGAAMNWLDANTTCRTQVLALRTGWRLSTVEELSSLIDHRATNPALPQGQPFVSVQASTNVWAYWTSTNHENLGDRVVRQFRGWRRQSGNEGGAIRTFSDSSGPCAAASTA
jgi:hypothetical protein